MAYDYNNMKKIYESMSQEDRNRALEKYGNNATYNQFLSDYQKETRNNTVSNPNINTTTPTYQYWDTGGAANANKYTGTWVSGGGNFQYSSTINTSKLWSDSLLFWNRAAQYESNNAWYLEKRNNAIANALYNEWKTDEQAIRNYLNTFQDYRDYDITGQNNTVTAIMNRIWNIASQYWNNGDNLNSKLESEIWNNYNNAKKWYSDLMWWWSNYAQDFDTAVKDKLQKAYWISDLNEFKSRYPEQYESLVQSLESVRWVWDATNPNERQMLDGALQGIIWSGVGAWSDWSKLNVLESSIMDKFQNPDKIKQDAQNVIKLQTEWKSIGDIAKEMWISEDQVQQLVLLANWLDSKAWEYYQLKDEAAKDITEPYDTKMQRLEEEKKIALDRANRNVEWLKDDFDTNMQRQKQQNDINLHNADFLAGQYWYWFSKRGIEWLNYTTTQAQQIIDDLTKNYDRNSQEMADGIADIIRNWQWNNEDLMKASQDALTNAKNSFTSNMLAIQQQYGTVWLQAQQALANNVQSFIEQAETIYDNALTRQQQNLSNLITNVSNLNALSAQNLTLRQAKIEQFQSESMNLNRNQLQSLAGQLWMDTASYQDLVNYQVQAVQNQLNGYLPWSWLQFQSQIQSLLDQWYTPNQAMQSVMNSQEWKAATTDTWEWKVSWNYMYNNVTWDVQQLWWDYAMSNGYLYDKSTWDWIDLNSDEWVKINDNTVMNKRDWTTRTLNWTDNYVSYETINGQTYGVSQKTYNTLANFYNQFTDENWNLKTDAIWWQCGTFVKKYLSQLWITRPNISSLESKKAQINTPKWYSPQVWDVVVMDSPYAETKANGHVAIVIWVDWDKITTLESNKKNNDQKVFSRTIDTSKTKVHWYYHPDWVASTGGGTWWDTTNDEAKQIAQAVMNGTWQLPAKNSKNYGAALIELDKLINDKYWGATPKWADLILYSVKNDKQLDNSAVEALDWVFTSLYNAEYLTQTLEENKKKTWPLISKLYKLNPRDADYASIKAQINAMSSKIARWFGEKWVLTDYDIERYMKAIPNEKLWDKANEVVWDLLQAKLYKWLMNTLEQYAKAGRDVHLRAEDYKMAEQWLMERHFIDRTTSSGWWRWGLSGGWSMSWAGWRW